MSKGLKRNGRANRNKKRLDMDRFFFIEVDLDEVKGNIEKGG